MKVAVVILAAGSSSRLGEPKQLVQFGGERLLERAVRIASEAGCKPVIVVLGANAQKIAAECRLEQARVLLNEDWAEGMASSIRAGVAAIDEEADGAIVMTCDQTAVTAAHLRKLMSGEGLLASAYAGRCGVPAFFPVATFAELLQLRGDVGARRLLQSAATIELAGGELDVDTPEALAALKELRG